VIEVGLGGRLDSTNVITPMVSAITSISLDHEQHLGRTLAAIAREKAGIVKAGIPVVVGRLDPEAEHAIEQVAIQCGAEFIRAWDEVTIEEILPQKTAEISSGIRVRLRTPVREYRELKISLRGRHQIGNALIAVRLLELLQREGIEVPERAIAEGLANPAWPGRLEHRCLADGREAILDAAHNPAGAAALAAYLTELSTAKLPIVFAAMRDKDIDGMFEALTPVASVLVLTRASNARSADPEILARHAAAIAPNLSVIVQPAREAALRTAWSHSPRIVIAGSIFLLGDVMKEISWS
jgi:dihydrofolate synthase/folylpolyglutamate synthase